MLFQANWGLVALNRKLFFVGSYPAEEAFRIWIALFLAVGLIAMTYGIWGGRLRPYLIVVGVVAALRIDARARSRTANRGAPILGHNSVRWPVNHYQWHQQGARDGGGMGALVVVCALSLGLAVPFGATWVLLAGVFGTLAGGAVIGKRFVAKYRSNQILLQGIGALWVLLIPAVVLLQIGVSTNHWESAFLDIIIFSVGVFFSFFIGLALAMGRVSAYRAIRISTVGYIEVVRAAPLLVWLLFATFLKGELGPVGEAFSSIDLVYRVMFVFAFFRRGIHCRGDSEAACSRCHRDRRRRQSPSGSRLSRCTLSSSCRRRLEQLSRLSSAGSSRCGKTLPCSRQSRWSTPWGSPRKVLGGQTDIAEGAFFEIYLMVALIYWVIS